MKYSEYHDQCKLFAIVDTETVEDEEGVVVKETLKYRGLYADLFKRNEKDIEVPKHYSHDRVTVSKDEDGNIIIGQDMSKRCQFQDQLREIRNQKLKETDWIEYAPLSEEMKNKWREYRQSLRDFIQNYNGEGIWHLDFPVDPNGNGIEFVDYDIDLDKMYSNTQTSTISLETSFSNEVPSAI